MVMGVVMNNGLTKDFDALATDEKDAIPVIEWLKSIKDKEAVEKAMEALRITAVDDKWEELRKTIKELNVNNSDNVNVEQITRFILNLMEVLDKKELSQIITLIQ